MLRNKKILSLSMALSVLAACLPGIGLVAMAEQTKSLKNGTFMKVEDSVPGWNEDVQSYLVTSENAGSDSLPNYAGNYLRIEQGKNVSSNYFDVKKGAPYRINGYYKTSGANTAKVGAVHYEMESGEAVHVADYLSDSLTGTENVWTYFEHSFTIPADSPVVKDAVCLQLRAEEAGEGHVWFAKISVKENLLNNGEFELRATNDTINATFAQDWKINYGTGSSCDTVTYQMTGGTDNSSYVTVGTTDGESYPYISQGGIPFKAGKVYTLSFDFMTTLQRFSTPTLRICIADTKGDNYNIDLLYQRVKVAEQIDGDHKTYQTEKNDSYNFLGRDLTANTWYRKSISFVCPEGDWVANKSSIQLRHNNNNKSNEDTETGVITYGTSCFDNLCLVEEDEAPAFAYYNEDGAEISTIQNGESATAKLHYIGSNTQDTETVITFTGIYTKDNKLISITPPTKQTVRHNLTLKESKTDAVPVKPCLIVTNTDFETAFTAPTEGEFIVKSFVWNDFFNLNLSSVLEHINISNIKAE